MNERSTREITFLVFLTLGGACGGKTGTEGSYAVGDVDGKPLKVNSAIVSYFACPPASQWLVATLGPQSPETRAIVLLTEAADPCSLAQKGELLKAPEAGLLMELVSSVSTAGDPPRPDSYDPLGNGSIQVVYEPWLGSLAANIGYGAGGNVIVVDEGNVTGAKGTFDLAFGSWGALRGSFDARRCDVSSPDVFDLVGGSCGLPTNKITRGPY
jgi:hypothetical protein